MAYSDFKADSTMQAQAYEELYWVEELENSFFSRFFRFDTPGDTTHIEQDASMGIQESDQKMPVVMKRALEKTMGDKVNFDLVLALSGRGIIGSGGKTLWENAEAITPYTNSLELEEYANAVVDQSKKGRKRVSFDVPKAMYQALSSWGVDKMDDLCFEAVEASPTSIMYAGSATSTATITASDTATMELLRKAKVKFTTRNAGARYLGKGCKVNNGNYVFAVCSPDIVYDIKSDSEYKESIQNAGQRGDMNPIFAGAEFITVDGIVVFSSERASIFTNWGSGSTVPGGYITMFGQKALLIATGQAPTIVEETRDFGREIGWGYSMMLKAGKPVFNSIDYGSMQIRCARTKISDLS